MIEGLTIGRIVHYTFMECDVPKRPDAVGTDAAAIVVQDWNTPNGCVNLLIFADGTNDTGDSSRGNVLWLTSREFSEKPEPGKWHWPERANQTNPEPEVENERAELGPEDFGEE